MANLKVKEVSTMMGSTIVTGFVRSGELKVGMRAKLNDRTLEIKTLEAGHRPATIAKTGDAVSISVKLFSNVFGAGIASGKPNPEYELLKNMVGGTLEFN
jgi:translation elongation factor EF-1alpha